MILQALVKEYEVLADQGKLDRPGWSSVGVSYALDLDEDGTLLGVLTLKETVTVQKKGGKTEMKQVPQKMALPEPVKRTVGISPNFLCDNSSYFLGIDNKGKPKRAMECFRASRGLHHRLLEGADTPMASAICRFFERWEPEQAAKNPILAPYLEDILKGANLIFSLDFDYAQEIPEIRAAWQAEYDKDEDAIRLPCLVTGQKAPVSVLHPNLKGVRGAQSSGAALVSFNAQAYESFGHAGDQGLNAPVSKYAAFAYGAALNYLLSDRERVLYVGDTTVVCWAENGQQVYQDAMCGALNDQDLFGYVKKIACGEPADFEGIPLDGTQPFYVLGLAPNAARVSVRFFLRGTFGDYMKRLNVHLERLEIQRPEFAQGKRSVWGLLQETLILEAANQSPSPQLSGDLLRAILTGGRYPQTLLNAVERRLRAGDDLNWRKAAILKAILLRNYQKEPQIQEVCTVKLNEESSYVPYVLGRIFCLYEQIQESANPAINATIRDRYFNSAAATPAVVFGTLGRLSQSHLRKLEAGRKIYLQQKLTALFAKLDAPIPARLTLPEQAAFQLGYYHETQKRYTKKEEQ